MNSDRLCEIANRWNAKDNIVECTRSCLDDPQQARNPPIRLVEVDRPRSSDMDTDMQDLPWRKDEPQERSNEARVGDLARSLESRKGREKSGEPLTTIDLEEDEEIAIEALTRCCEYASKAVAVQEGQPDRKGSYQEFAATIDGHIEMAQGMWNSFRTKLAWPEENLDALYTKMVSLFGKALPMRSQKKQRCNLTPPGRREGNTAGNADHGVEPIPREIRWSVTVAPESLGDAYHWTIGSNSIVFEPATGTIT